MYLRKSLIPTNYDNDNDDNLELDNSFEINNTTQQDKPIKAIYLKTVPKASKLSSSLNESDPITWSKLYQKLFRPMLNVNIKPKNGRYITIEEIELRLKLLLLQVDINSIFKFGKANSRKINQTQLIYSKLKEEKDNDVPSIIYHFEDKMIYQVNKENHIDKSLQLDTKKQPNEHQIHINSKKRLSLINSLSHCTSLVKGTPEQRRVKRMKTNRSSKDNNNGNGNGIGMMTTPNSSICKKKVVGSNKSIVLKQFEEMRAEFNFHQAKMKEIEAFLNFNPNDKLNSTIFVDNHDKRMSNLLKYQNETVNQMENLFMKIKAKFNM